MAKITLNDINNATTKSNDFVDLFGGDVQPEKRKKKLKVDIHELEANELNGFYVADDENLQELSEVINDDGMSNPIRVKEKGENGKYTILSGHRRWMAALKAGMTQVEIIVVPNDFSLSEEIAYITRENGGSRGDDPFGRAYMVQMYENEQKNIPEEKRISVGEALRLKRTSLQRLLKLASLPVEILKAGQCGYITQNDAITLADNLANHKIIGNTQIEEIKKILASDEKDKQKAIKDILLNKKTRNTKPPVQKDDFVKVQSAVSKLKKMDTQTLRGHVSELIEIRKTIDALLNKLNDI